MVAPSRVRELKHENIYQKGQYHKVAPSRVRELKPYPEFFVVKVKRRTLTGA